MLSKVALCFFNFVLKISQTFRLVFFYSFLVLIFLFLTFFSSELKRLLVVSHEHKFPSEWKRCRILSRLILVVPQTALYNSSPPPSASSHPSEVRVGRGDAGEGQGSLLAAGGEDFGWCQNRIRLQWCGYLSGGGEEAGEGGEACVQTVMFRNFSFLLLFTEIQDELWQKHRRDRDVHGRSDTSRRGNLHLPAERRQSNQPVQPSTDRKRYQT